MNDDMKVLINNINFFLHRNIIFIEQMMRIEMGFMDYGFVNENVDAFPYENNQVTYSPLLSPSSL